MRTRKIHSLLILVVSFSGLILMSLHKLAMQAEVPPAQPDLDAIDAYITSQMRAHRIRGLALAITSGDKIVHLQGYGTAGDSREMTAQTPLYLASVTKSFTALAVMQLVEQGLIDLDLPVQTYLPWFKVADQEGSRQITVRHLLNQTSGLSTSRYAQKEPPAETLEDTVRDLQHAHLIAPVGTKFQYSGGNFNTLGLLIEAVSGLSYGQYIQQHVFDPLEMRRSFVSLQPAEQAGLSQGHNVVLGFPLPQQTSFLAQNLPEGFIISTAEDMAHYLIAQNNAGRYASASVLSPAGVVEMHRPTAEIGSPYAMGWYAIEDYGTRVIYHTGEMQPTFYAHVVLLPDEGYGIALLVNQFGGLHVLMAYPAIMEGVANMLLGNQRSRGLPLSVLFGIITAVIIVHVIQFVRRLSSLPRWERGIGDKAGGKLAREIAGHFFLSLLLFLGFPYLLTTIFGSLFTWSRFFLMVPGIAVWLLFTILSDLGLGIAKAWLVLRQRRGWVA